MPSSSAGRSCRKSQRCVTACRGEICATSVSRPNAKPLPRSVSIPSEAPHSFQTPASVHQICLNGLDDDIWCTGKEGDIWGACPSVLSTGTQRDSLFEWECFGCRLFASSCPEAVCPSWRITSRRQGRGNGKKEVPKASHPVGCSAIERRWHDRPLAPHQISIEPRHLTPSLPVSGQRIVQVPCDC